MKQTTVAGFLVTATVGVVGAAVVLYFVLRWNFQKYEVSVAVFLNREYCNLWVKRRY